MQSDSGIRLEREGEQADLFSLEKINATLAPIGTRIWAQDWSSLPADLKDFLGDPDPSPERIAEVTPRFLLPRERGKSKKGHSTFSVNPVPRATFIASI